MLSSLKHEFARNFSLRGTQSSHGGIFLGWSGGKINEIQPEAFLRILAAILEFFGDALMTDLRGGLAPAWIAR